MRKFGGYVQGYNCRTVYVKAENKKRATGLIARRLGARVAEVRCKQVGV